MSKPASTDCLLKFAPLAESNNLSLSFKPLPVTAHGIRVAECSTVVLPRHDAEDGRPPEQKALSMRIPVT
jgi:hypothetical protein